MSSLYVRVMTGFYTHKKTLRLKARIGSDAFWVPPRLWAYAAENQPDGDFSDYTPKEIAELIGYSGDAEAMLQAMLQASFMDSEPLRIHSWEEHNGYHQTFAIRAKKAAEARWAEKKEVTKKEDKDKTRTRQGQDKEASIPSSNATSMEAIHSEKTEIQLRAEKLFHRRVSTPMSDSERKAFKINRVSIESTSEKEWLLLERFHAAPQSETYARRDLATLFNNWNGELDRAKAWEIDSAHKQKIKERESMKL